MYLLSYRLKIMNIQIILDFGRDSIFIHELLLMMYIYVSANFQNISELGAQIDYRFYITNYRLLSNMYIFRQKWREIIKIIIKIF